MTALVIRLLSRLRFCGGVVLVLMVAFGHGAGAQPNAREMARAQALFDQGIYLFNLGRFEESCPKFEASLALVAGIGTRGKLAECYEKLGRTASAWRLYREVERLAHSTGDTVRERIAAERAQDLEPRLARMTIMPGPSVTVVGFAIARNSLAVDPRTYGSVQEVDPGMYAIVATAPGRHKWATTVRVEEGKSAVVKVAALALAGGMTRPPLGARRMAAYGLVGAGIASGLGGGLYFGAKARSFWLKVDDKCTRELGTIRCAPDDIPLADKANRYANYANVSVVVGAAALAGGVYLWLQSKPAAIGPMHVTPAVSPDSAGVMLHGVF